jgi:hypothetical protein
MNRSLDIASGQNGGAQQLAKDPGRARNINVTVLNPTAAVHAAFFGRNRRELTSPPVAGIGGFAVVAVPNTVVNQTIGGVAYTSFVIQGWSGELWVAADAPNVISVEVMDSASAEA